MHSNTVTSYDSSALAVCANALTFAASLAIPITMTIANQVIAAVPSAKRKYAPHLTQSTQRTADSSNCKVKTSQLCKRSHRIRNLESPTIPSVYPFLSQEPSPGRRPQIHITTPPETKTHISTQTPPPAFPGVFIHGPTLPYRRSQRTILLYKQASIEPYHTIIAINLYLITQTPIGQCHELGFFVDVWFIYDFWGREGGHIWTRG